jgi:hypothetical protein
MQLISTEDDAKAESRNESFVGCVYDDKDSGKRFLDTGYCKRKGGRFLGCVKKVMGGAFSAHEDIFADGEHNILTKFLEAKAAFPAHMDMSISDPIRHYRAKLQRLADAVVEDIKNTFAQEVTFYLTHFAKVLANTLNPLGWNLIRNNCQKFYTTLLKGLPIDSAFHRAAEESCNYEGQSNRSYAPTPHYCLSFGFDIDTPAGNMYFEQRPQIRSIIWNYYRRKRDYCDIIEFSEQFRTRLCARPLVPWEVLDVTDNSSTPHNTLVDVLWALPRDSISILQTHLQRNSYRYSTNEGKAVSECDWYENRLRVLHQLHVFTSLSSGLARAIKEQAVERNLSQIRFLNAKEFGTLYASEKITVYPGAFYRVSGRERDGIKRDLEYNVKKLWSKIDANFSTK